MAPVKSKNTREYYRYKASEFILGFMYGAAVGDFGEFDVNDIY